jgi:hypothetical protein
VQLRFAGFCVSSPVEPRTWRADDEVGRMDIVATRVEGGNESFDVLFDENVFICDSEASNHSSKSKAGAQNERPANSSSLVTLEKLWRLSVPSICQGNLWLKMESWV